MESKSVAVCILLYGDHLKLAMRCIESIRKAKWHDSVNIIIGMNAVCADTREYVYRLYGDDPKALIFDSDENLRKYPMMRRMFYDADGGALSYDYVMWFDDDSYLHDGSVAQRPDWLNGLIVNLQENADIIGGRYTRKWQGQQKQWVRHQPWFNPRVNMNTDQLVFITGGWWITTSAMLRKADYPWRSLSHNGGDSMLGEMCRHVGHVMMSYCGGVAVNANDAGVNAKAPRRGISEQEIGAADTAGSLIVATTPKPGTTVRTVGDNGR